MLSTLDRIALIERLQVLREQGAISETEFFDQKSKFLVGQSRSTEAPYVPGLGTQDAFDDPSSYAAQTNGTRAIAVIALLLIGAAVAYLWAKSAASADPAFREYAVISAANVRSVPTASDSNIVGTLKKGELVSGSLEATLDGQEWLKVTGPQFSGSYVWAKNLKVRNDQTAKEVVR